MLIFLTAWVILAPESNLLYNSLCGVVRSQMGRDPLSGEVFIFINKKRHTVKLLHWERGGLVIFHKRLESNITQIMDSFP